MTNDAPETDHLEDIKARASVDYAPLAPGSRLAASDMTWLMAEVERLRSLITRLAQSDQLHFRGCGPECAAGCLQAQIDKLMETWK